MLMSYPNLKDDPYVTERRFGYCPVCGFHADFRSYAPLDFPCKRNDFICHNCGSVGRNRHLAIVALDEFKPRAKASSLKEFAGVFDGAIYITCVKEAVSRALCGGRNVTSSEFIDGVPSGEYKDGNLCQDIQNTTFADNSFDLVITEDVLEHVPEPKQAFAEIRRILKPGGLHISTIPVEWDKAESFPRAKIIDGELVHLTEPEYHGDPFRPEGILAYTTYGQDILEQYCSIIGPSKIIEANTDKLYEDAFAVFNNWVFVSQKPA